MPFFDFHIHPTLKCLFSEDDPANGLTQLSPWVPIDKSKIPLLLRWCTEFPEIIQTQGNLALLSATDTNLVCVALHIPEKAIISDNLITTATNGPLQAYLQAKRIGEIINGNPYLILTTSDLDTLTNPQKFGVTDKKIKTLDKRPDYNEADANTLHVVFSVEGCHTLSSALEHFDSIEVISNLDDLRKKIKVLSVNLTHLEQSDFCNHAFGMQFLSNERFKPTGRMIANSGIQILTYCYRNKIMIDLKHMSLGARQHLYQLRGSHDLAPVNQPLICTHAGFTGISIAEIPDYVFQRRPFPANGYTVLWHGKPVKYGSGNLPRPSFNPSSINLFDEDIIQILQSGGMIGLSLDKRILGYQQFEEPTSDRDDFPMETEYISNQEAGIFFPDPNASVGSAFENDTVLGWDEIYDGGVVVPALSGYHLKYFMAHVLHLIVVARKSGYDINKALTQICIGSDFDGLIDPIWICSTVSGIADFKDQFTKSFVQFASDSNVALPPGFDAGQFAEQLFFTNGRDFVLNRLDVLNA